MIGPQRRDAWYRQWLRRRRGTWPWHWQRGAASVAAVVLSWLVPVSVLAAEESATLGDVNVVVWTKDGEPDQRRPVVVFSHGMYMCPTQARYLTRALADAGYLVVAPRHADSSCEFSIEFSNPFRLSMKPSLWWGESDYRDRAEDIRKVVAALQQDERFRDRSDVRRLALVGHSLGGYTVLGLGGAWPSWTLPGVKAILALAPYSLPFQRSGGLSKLAAPVMYQSGTLDPVFTLPLGWAQGGYEQSPVPKYFVEIEGAEHLAWTDIGFGGREAIVAYAIAFLDRHVKGEWVTALQVRLPGAADFRHDSRAW